MQVLRYSTLKTKDISILDTIKILLIIFVSISLLANFVPFYYGADSFLYGTTALDLTNGSYGISNELILESGSGEFCHSI